MREYCGDCVYRYILEEKKEGNVSYIRKCARYEKEVRRSGNYTYALEECKKQDGAVEFTLALLWNVFEITDGNALLLGIAKGETESEVYFNLDRNEYKGRHLKVRRVIDTIYERLPLIYRD